MRVSIFLAIQNASVTAGFTCAPLSVPTLEIAMSPPVDPNRNPVMIWRIFTPGIHTAAGLPSPNMKITTESPTSSSAAVPIISARYIRQRLRKSMAPAGPEGPAYIQPVITAKTWRPHGGRSTNRPRDTSSPPSRS